MLFVVILTELYAGKLQFPEINNWQKEDTVAVYSPSNLWERINGAADQYLNYGFRKLYAVDLRNGNVGLALEIYDMGTPLNAFGIYTTESPPQKEKLKIGTEAVVAAPSQGFLLKNRYYVKLEIFEGKMTDEMGRNILQDVDAALSGNASYPIELEFLPQANLIKGSYAYVKTGFQGLNELENCLTAHYKSNDSEKFQYFMLIPAAEENSESLLKKIAEKWQSISYMGNTIYYREIPYKGIISIAIINDRAIGVTDSPDQETMLKRFFAIFNEK